MTQLAATQEASNGTGWLIFGLLLILAGLAGEALMGSFRHILDFRWIKRRWPRSPGNQLKLILGRLGIAVGLVSSVIGVVLIGARAYTHQAGLP